jgi:hypothetical protein
MDLYARGFFTNFGHEHILDRDIDFLRGSIYWVPKQARRSYRVLSLSISQLAYEIYHT